MVYVMKIILQLTFVALSFAFLFKERRQVGVNNDNLKLEQYSNPHHNSIPDDLSTLFDNAIDTYGTLKPSFSCLRSSLDTILPNCAHEGIEGLDPLMKIIVTIKLSVCEFELSQVPYPATCNFLVSNHDWNNEKNIYQCVDEFQQIPQLWTTYSGNFQSISHFCKQESLPYEKDQLITLFSNITKLNKQSHSILSKVNPMITNIFSKMHLFKDFIDEVDVSLGKKISIIINNATINFQNELNHAIRNISDNQKKSFSNEFDSFRTEFDGFKTELEIVEKQQIKSAENLSNYLGIVIRQMSLSIMDTLTTSENITELLGTIQDTTKNILNIHQELHKITATIVDRQDKIQENMETQAENFSIWVNKMGTILEQRQKTHLDHLDWVMIRMDNFTEIIHINENKLLQFQERLELFTEWVDWIGNPIQLFKNFQHILSRLYLIIPIFGLVMAIITVLSKSANALSVRNLKKSKTLLSIFITTIILITGFKLKSLGSIFLLFYSQNKSNVNHDQIEGIIIRSIESSSTTINSILLICIGFPLGIICTFIPQYFSKFNSMIKRKSNLKLDLEDSINSRSEKEITLV